MGLTWPGCSCYSVSVLDQPKANYPVLNKVYSIRTDETGSDGCLDFRALMLYLQDAAGCHAAELGWSMSQLGEEGKGWVLSSCRIEFETLPGWQQSLEVQTWPSGVDRLFARRDYLLKDSSGVVVGRGESRWLIMDLNRRRPVRLPRDFAERIGEHLAPNFDDPPVPILAGFSGPVLLQTRILPTDLDVNRHVNHVRYIDWILSVASAAGSQAGILQSVEVEFRAEGFEGEEIAVRHDGSTCGSGCETLTLSLGRTASDEVLAAARLRYRLP